MRRWLGVVMASALVAVLCPRLAFAAFTPAPANGDSDLRTQIYQRVFGESAERETSFIADDRLSESFFRDYALRIGALPAGRGVAQISIPQWSLPLLSVNLFQPQTPALVTGVRASDYRVPAIATPFAEPSYDPGAAPVIGLYQDAQPQPTTGPASFRFDMSRAADPANNLVTFSPTLDPQEAFSAGSTEPDASTTLPQTQAGVTVPVRVGHVHVQPHVEGAQADVPSLALHDNAVNTGATFNTRVGSQKFDIDVSSGFEHLTVNDPTTLNSSSFDSTSNVQVGAAGNLPVLVPAYADVSKHTLAAGVGVPVARNVTVAVQAETQHLQGGYGSPGLTNLDARNNVYGGKVTFQLPHAASVSLSAKQYRYQDNLTPTTFTQTSANVNFTVKF